MGCAGVGCTEGLIEKNVLVGEEGSNDEDTDAEHGPLCEGDFLDRFDDVDFADAPGAEGALFTGDAVVEVTADAEAAGGFEEEEEDADDADHAVERA